MPRADIGCGGHNSCRLARVETARIREREETYGQAFERRKRGVDLGRGADDVRIRPPVGEEQADGP